MERKEDADMQAANQLFPVVKRHLAVIIPIFKFLEAK